MYLNIYYYLVVLEPTVENDLLIAQIQSIKFMVAFSAGGQSREYLDKSKFHNDHFLSTQKLYGNLTQ